MEMKFLEAILRKTERIRNTNIRSELGEDEVKQSQTRMVRTIDVITKEVI